MTDKPESKRKRGRPETRVLKIDVTLEEVVKAMFAAGKSPYPSKKSANPRSNRTVESFPYKFQSFQYPGLTYDY